MVVMADAEEVSLSRSSGFEVEEKGAGGKVVDSSGFFTSSSSVVGKEGGKEEDELELEGFSSEEESVDFIDLHMLLKQSTDNALQASMFVSSRAMWSAVLLCSWLDMRTWDALERVSKNCWKEGGRSSEVLDDMFVLFNGPSVAMLLVFLY